MATITSFLTRHPVATYFALTFTISWGGMLLIIGGPAGMTGMKAQDNPLFRFAVLAMVAGPSLAGLLMTGLIDGRSGLRHFRSAIAHVARERALVCDRTPGGAAVGDGGCPDALAVVP